MKYITPIWLIILTFLVTILFADIDIIKHYSKKEINAAQFAPNSEGFQSVDTHIGKLAVSLQKIEKYANGHKVILQIGNPTSATIADTEIIVKYGVAFEDTDKDFTDWYQDLKESEKTFSKEMLPGTWNNVEITLSPSTDEETGFISVELNPKKISLNVKK